MKMTREDLQAKYPEIYNQVMEAGRAEARAEAEAELRKIRSGNVDVEAAAKKSRKETLDLIECHLGAEARSKVQMALDSGMTPEQLKASKELFGKPAGASGTRQRILEGLEACSNKDFMTQVSAYQNHHDCKRSVAINAVAAARPDLHDKWLQEQQGQ